MGEPIYDSYQLDAVLGAMKLDGAAMTRIAGYRATINELARQLSLTDPEGSLRRLGEIRVAMMTIHTIMCCGPRHLRHPALAASALNMFTRSLKSHERRYREAAEAPARAERERRAELLCREQAEIDPEGLMAEETSLLVGADGRPPPSCFITHVWPTAPYSRRESWVQSFTERLRGHLRAAGVNAIADTYDYEPGERRIRVTGIHCQQSTIVFAMCTESLFAELDDSPFCDTQLEFAVIEQRTDDELRASRLAGQRAGTAVYPVLLSGTFASAVPPMLRRLNHIDALAGGGYTAFVARLASICHGRILNTPLTDDAAMDTPDPAAAAATALMAAMATAPERTMSDSDS